MRWAGIELTEQRIHWAVILAAAFVAVVPLMVHGCSCGHDFDFHAVSWIDAARQLSHGTLYPHWAYTPAYFAGEPRFVFYPPLSWMAGALIGLLLTHIPGVSASAGWNATPIIFTWLALSLSGITCYRLAHEFLSRNIALLSAVVHLGNPYMLFTAYERTAYAELLSEIWIPILLLALLRRRMKISGVALPVAALWLTNAPAAVIGSYAVVSIIVIRLFWQHRFPAMRTQPLTRTALNAAVGTALGLALAGLYLIPAQAERRFVQIGMVLVPGMRIQDNFIFLPRWRLPLLHFAPDPAVLADVPHAQVLSTVSWISVWMLGGTAAALLISLLNRRSRHVAADTSGFLLIVFSALALGIAFLMTPLSAPLWPWIPEASFLQFPWRTLGMLGTVFAVSVGLMIESVQQAWSRAETQFAETGKPGLQQSSISAAVALSISVLLVWVAYGRFRQPCDEEDTASAQLALIQSGIGTDPTDEYTPTNADNDVLDPKAPEFWLAKSADAGPPLIGETPAHGPAPLHLKIDTATAEFLVLNLRDYPAWRVYRNGVPLTGRAYRDDGLLAVPIPPGPASIDVHYSTGWDHILGDLVTAGAFAIWLVVRRRDRTYEALSPA
jgi:hypothetical protein